MDLAELFLGQIPEAVYFGLFLILAKNIKEKRLLFIILMTIEYALLFNVLRFSCYAHLIFFILTYSIMKMLYKDKCQITDIFTIMIASIILILISIISFLLANQQIILSSIISIVFKILVLLLLRSKLCKIQLLYNKLWNRNDLVKKKIKSTTFRSLNVVVFNLVFYLINLGMLVAVVYNKGGA